MARHNGARDVQSAAAASAGQAVMRRLDELARFSHEPDALTRLYLTPEHQAAAIQLKAWMQEAGMTARIDAAGSVVGRYEATEPGLPAIILGSHIDTVRNAGRYDGAFGVVAAIQVVSELHAAGERMPFAIEVIAFGDEEGVRFPVTLTSSCAVAGILDPASLDATDENGTSVREALQDFGCNPGDIPGEARRPGEVLAYIEAHIEQGPVLETEDLPVGVVTAIGGASRYMIEIEGVAGHAGTVPMQLRQDAACAAAEMILAAERIARETGDLVVTVGLIEILPGAVNVIASAARFSLDVRSPSDAVRRAGVMEIIAAFERIAMARRVRLRTHRSYDAAAAPCAGLLVEQLEAAVSRAGIKPRRLPSGAGHDGLAMITLCPIGMLFVRCLGGVSHNPSEAITEADAAIAVRVLADFLRNLDPVRLAAREQA